MKLREHRGSLEESLGTSIELPNTMEALVAALRQSIQAPSLVITKDTVHVQWYAYDHRLDTPDVWIVSIKGYGVYGFTDSDVKE